MNEFREGMELYHCEMEAIMLVDLPSSLLPMQTSLPYSIDFLIRFSISLITKLCTQNEEHNELAREIREHFEPMVVDGTLRHMTMQAHNSKQTKKAAAAAAGSFCSF